MLLRGGWVAVGLWGAGEVALLGQQRQRPCRPHRGG